jgi:hypothetical protein
LTDVGQQEELMAGKGTDLANIFSAIAKALETQAKKMRKKRPKRKPSGRNR